MNRMRKFLTVAGVMICLGLFTAFAVNIKGAIVDAATGYTQAGAAPSGHCLTGNGTVYVDASLCGYKTVQSAGTPVTQRGILDFVSEFALSDNGSATVVDLANAGTSGTYAYPTSVTTDQFGRVTAVSAGTVTGRTCGANGCYRIEADGTIEQWGNSAAATSGGTAQRVSILFPINFTTTTGLSVITSPTGEPSGDGNPHPLDCHLSTGPTTAGATATIAMAVQPGGSGYSDFAGGEVCSWHATGN